MIKNVPWYYNNRQGCLLSLLFKIILAFQASEIRQGKKKIKGLRIGKEEIKLSFADDMFVHVQSWRDSLSNK